ncbi:MAG: S-methyl-5-thioribose-1-phosphate isomerase [Oscillospiraceae bacterium]|jgi:methylthioribose-1-phosphate isomerase|nr:S-methyl-5-thioribose-1-phosphate isomerase [Oscillospiraceae bacterium]
MMKKREGNRLPDTVALDEERNALVIIDQTALPGELKLLSLTTLEEFIDAIKTLKVRGAPAIGVAAAMGLYLAVKRSGMERLGEVKAALAASRPTAVNLFWALDRMEQAALACPDAPLEALRLEALRIRDEDIQACRAIGEHGLALLLENRHKEGALSLLTHCNAGSLAAVRIGTALAPVYAGLERGYRFKVYAGETRPLLQGARLTAFELMAAGVDTTLICDNMASIVMQKGMVQAVLTGADRIAANGDVCNKVGTSGLAVLAKHYGIPFYVCAPMSTVDFQSVAGEDILIEERDGQEVTEMWFGKRMAPKGVNIFNPAFDVTPHTLVTAIVTERGVLRPPYAKSLTP